MRVYEKTLMWRTAIDQKSNKLLKLLNQGHFDRLYFCYMWRLLDDAAGGPLQLVFPLCKICQGHRCIDLLPVRVVLVRSPSISCTGFKHNRKKMIKFTVVYVENTITEKHKWQIKTEYASPVTLIGSIFQSVCKEKQKFNYVPFFFNLKRFIMNYQE